MNPEKDYLNINKSTWNDRVEGHLQSDFYQMDAFLQGENALNEIELNLLGDISGKSILHLQCHFGQDSLSLARMGAKVTGVDFSEKAIQEAKKLNNQLSLDAEFVCSDIYSLPENLEAQFDIVFTSYGTIGWLPDMEKWAQVVRKFLKPGGRFVMADFHPVVWMLDDDFKEIFYSYFNRGPIVEQVQGSYAQTNNNTEYKTVGWNHSFSEILSALLKSGLTLNQFQEFDYSPYSCFPHLKKLDHRKFVFSHLEGKVPMVYAFEMTL